MNVIVSVKENFYFFFIIIIYMLGSSTECVIIGQLIYYITYTTLEMHKIPLWFSLQSAVIH